MVVRGKYENSGEEFYFETAEKGETLLSMLRERQINIDAPCGGNKACGRCRVRFAEGVCELSEKDRLVLQKEEQEAGIRLACTACPKTDCRIILPDEGWESVCAVAEYHAAEETDEGTAQQEQASSGKKKYGIAVDIGTTTIAMALIFLPTGEQRAAVFGINHQRAYGADVITRIQAANEGKDKILRECIRADLRRLIAELLKKAGVSPDEVAKAAVVGNTAMCHLLRGLSCKTLGTAPFLPADLSLFCGDCGALFGFGGLSAEAFILPGISAFVGADIVSGIYAGHMDDREETALLVDIGTNGEMAIGNRDGFLVTSAAAGPVFEGGNISCGMPGVAGAIAHIFLRKEAGAYKTECETIGGGFPKGLCGTGVVDLTAELLREKLIDENGTMKEPWFTGGFPAAESVRFLQRDIREVQMGKAAICAGVETLLCEYAPGAAESVPVCLAGGFGYFMDVERAITIGLFPKCFFGKVKAVGNSALEGAKRFLQREDAGEQVSRIAESAKEISLAAHPGFNERYVKHMNFNVPPSDGR